MYNVIYFLDGQAKYTWSENADCVVGAFRKCDIEAFILPSFLQVQA